MFRVLMQLYGSHPHPLCKRAHPHSSHTQVFHTSGTCSRVLHSLLNCHTISTVQSDGPAFDSVLARAVALGNNANVIAWLSGWHGENYIRRSADPANGCISPEGAGNFGCGAGRCSQFTKTMKETSKSTTRRSSSMISPRLPLAATSGQSDGDKKGRSVDMPVPPRTACPVQSNYAALCAIAAARRSNSSGATSSTWVEIHQ